MRICHHRVVNFCVVLGHAALKSIYAPGHLEGLRLRIRTPLLSEELRIYNGVLRRFSSCARRIQSTGRVRSIDLRILSVFIARSRLCPSSRARSEEY